MVLRITPVATAAALLMLLITAPVAQAAAPSNDDRAAARVLTLPASVDGTTQGATLEPTEPASQCSSGSKDSVWYLVKAPRDGRISVRLQASGDLDAVVDTYLRQRSQTTALECDETDTKGRSEVSFRVKAGESYLIRVAERANSASGTFRLDVFLPEPPPTFPGPPLPAKGVAAGVDVLQDRQDAYRVTLHTGVTYRINLALAGSGCASLELYGPGARSFDDPVADRLGCSGYGLFTPPSGEGGRYSLLVTAPHGVRGVQRYHLQVGRALGDDSAPGVFLRNFATAHGKVDGRRLDVVDLYRFDVKRRSELSLRLAAGDDLELTVRNDRGRIVASSSDGRVDRTLRPGRYFAAVLAFENQQEPYTLTRVSRAITRTRVGVPRSSAPGATVPVSVQVAPAANGPVRVIAERFDPLFGWLYVRQWRVTASAGHASVAFTPPAVGRFRFQAAFLGTRGAAASASGFAAVQVAGPLVE
ncbi:MAG TPA: hypothetical protein VMT10_00650 [Solirubrobacteraceae bacterium]|nr:hypothetical protein [Solirubrobacteraceae bacterium]